ncbi:dicarboxylate/amino acid:cation symporter [bacterium]|nr:dicarboxylate/amino acid:cation symporter [bacterium]
MRRALRWYFRTPLILRILVCFVAGAVLGGALWLGGGTSGERVQTVFACVSPFGTVFVHMLKMVVYPVIFFSLAVGSASLAISKFGRVGLKTLAWYLGCSVLAALVGVGLALAINPGSGAELGSWQAMATEQQADTGAIAAQGSGATAGGVLAQLLFRLFKNPFAALAEGDFLAIIVFAILFGLAIRVTIEAAHSPQSVARLEALLDVLRACQEATFRLVGWILEYSPIGVLALTIVNFGQYGPRIVGPYVSVTLGVVLGITTMVFVVYPVLLWLVTRQNPFAILGRIKEAMITAFITRSSAATLPVSIRTAEEKLGVRNELASFSLPLGATINMDGVCVHLPMFAVLAANMFGLELTAATLALLVLTTVLSSIGAGGVPSGSVFLLFVILQSMGLAEQQVAVIVALALGINPILDMFETMNNITGDLVCTYAVAYNEGLLGPAEGE